MDKKDKENSLLVSNTNQDTLKDQLESLLKKAQEVTDKLAEERKVSSKSLHESFNL